MRIIRKTGLANYDGCQLRQQPVIENTSAQGSGTYSAALDCPRTEQSGIRAGGEYSQVNALTELRTLAAIAVCSSCTLANMSPTEYTQAQTAHLTAQADQLTAEMRLMEVREQYEAALRAAKPQPALIPKLNAGTTTIEDTHCIPFTRDNPETTQPLGSALSEPTMVLPQYKIAETVLSEHVPNTEHAEQPVLPDCSAASEQDVAQATDERTVTIVPRATRLQIEQAPRAGQ